MGKYIRKTITTQDHGGTIDVYVLVVGYSNSIMATLNNSVMQMTWTAALDFNGDGIVDGFWYRFTGSGTSGTVEIRDFSNFQWAVRDRIYIR